MKTESKLMGKEFFRTIGSASLDLLYPPDIYCICCGKIIDSTMTYRLCGECMKGVKWAGERVCAKCGRRLSDRDPLDTCFNCREHAHSFDSGYACAEYGTHERAMIFALKYDGRTDIADTIGEIMYDRMTSLYEPDELAGMYDLVLPVPIHRRKKSVRGYNQAALIAESFARRAGLRWDDDILVRLSETRMMRNLSPDQRRENVRGAFGIREWRRDEITGRSILLIDDIYTTGATIDELAALLKDPPAPSADKPRGRGGSGGTYVPKHLRRGGAARVDFLTFAAGADIVKGE